MGGCFPPSPLDLQPWSDCSFIYRITEHSSFQVQCIFTKEILDFEDREKHSSNFKNDEIVDTNNLVDYDDIMKEISSGKFYFLLTVFM